MCLSTSQSEDGELAGDLGEDVGLAQDQQVLAVDGDDLLVLRESDVLAKVTG
jgi:co-chaperonin GroES (HSP10)